MLNRRELLRGLGVTTAAAGAGAIALACLHHTPHAHQSLATTIHPTAHAPLRLDRNENSFGPSPTVSAALHEAPGALNRYPDAEADLLRQQLARFHRIDPARVVIAPGSTAIMRLGAAAFLGSGRSLVIAEPSFDEMAQYARAAGAPVAQVPLTRLYQHDLPAMRKRVTEATGLVYICNPNNPTGTMTPRPAIEAFVNDLPPTVWVIIDEAYHPYVNPLSAETSFIDRPAANPRVIVTRTFSNIYGLAGMRLGYAVAAPASAARLDAYGVSEGLSVSALRAGRMALEDTTYVAQMANENVNAKQEFVNQAMARRLAPMDSEANFVLLYIDGCLEVAEHFRRHHIRIAANFPGLAESIRVTLGTSAEMREFWRVLDLKKSLQPF